MKIINFIHNYWTQIIFIIGIFCAVIKIIKTNNYATKCSLRNNILQIYDSCKDKEEISLYQLQAIETSYDLYKKLKGNGFIDDIVSKTRTFAVKK